LGKVRNSGKDQGGYWLGKRPKGVNFLMWRVILIPIGRFGRDFSAPERLPSIFGYPSFYWRNSS